MRKFEVRGKAKGFLQVMGSHFLVLFSTMLVSFILPMSLSVDEYGRWQMFSLVVSYAGFLALGFNDGIHVNYSGMDYDSEYHYLFRGFRIFIKGLSFIGTIVVTIVLIVFQKQLSGEFVLYLIAAMNILPVLMNGFYTYVNQGTMRFKYYAAANVIEKVVFIGAMVLLLVLQVDKALYYIVVYTLARYVVLIYNSFRTKELFGRPRATQKELRKRITNNMMVGISLMMAILCNQSIMVPGRLLVQNEYGLTAFSCYSFAIHTMVIVNQVATSFSQVFFPALKRTKKTEFFSTFRNIDLTLTLFSIILLLSYYPVAALVYIVYPQYRSILGYLHYLYPLFVFTSKSLILVINSYKLDGDNKRLLVNNALGVIICAVMAWGGHTIFGSIEYIALFSLWGYVIWYYLCYYGLLKHKKERIKPSSFIDLAVLVAFLLINIFCKKLFHGVIMEELLISMGTYMSLAVIAIVICRNKCKEILREFLAFINK